MRSPGKCGFREVIAHNRTSPRLHAVATRPNPRRQGHPSKIMPSWDRLYLARRPFAQIPDGNGQETRGDHFAVAMRAISSFAQPKELLADIASATKINVRLIHDELKVNKIVRPLAPLLRSPVQLLRNLIFKPRRRNRTRARKRKKCEELLQDLRNLHLIVFVGVANFIVPDFKLHRIPGLSKVFELHIARLHDILKRHILRRALTQDADFARKPFQPTFNLALRSFRNASRLVLQAVSRSSVTRDITSP